MKIETSIDLTPAELRELIGLKPFDDSVSKIQSLFSKEKLMEEYKNNLGGLTEIQRKYFESFFKKL